MTTLQVTTRNVAHATNMHGSVYFHIAPELVKLCTAKLCLENQNKTYRDQSYPKAFPLLNKRESNFPCSLAQITPDNKATLQHTLCFSRSGLSQRRSLGIQFKYCSKVTKTKEGFLSNCKLDSSLDEIPKSDPLRIKSFHSVHKLLKYFQTVQIIFGFLQKHHNSQLQNETSATAVSVVLVECHKIILASQSIRKRPKVYCWLTIFGQIKTTNYDLFICTGSKSN